MKTKLSVRFIKSCFFTTLMVTSFSLTAQDVPFKKGDKVIGLFAGTGVGYSYYSGASMPIALGVTYDQGFFDDIGPGNIGIGGVLAFKTSASDSRYYKTSYNSFIVAVRGTYHLTILADKNSKFDPYAGITVGLSFNNRRYKYGADYYDYYDYGYDYYDRGLNRVSTIAGAFVGAKYNFAEKIGVFAEAGYDFTFIRGGINFNF